MKLPYLVQRVTYRQRPKGVTPDGQGIDAHFAFDYMGSAEFEWGVLPKTLKIMRSFKRSLQVTPLEGELVVSPNQTVKVTGHFVGHPDDLPIAAELFRDELKERPEHRTKELTYLRRSYMLEHTAKTAVDTYGVCDAWWIVDAGWAQSFRDDGAGFCGSEQRPFVIFAKREHVDIWLGAM